MLGYKLVKQDNIYPCPKCGEAIDLPPSLNTWPIAFAVAVAIIIGLLIFDISHGISTRKAYLIGVEASARVISSLGSAHPNGFTIQQVIASADSLIASDPVGKKYPGLLQ